MNSLTLTFHDEFDKNGDPLPMLFSILRSLYLLAISLLVSYKLKYILTVKNKFYEKLIYI